MVPVRRCLAILCFFAVLAPVVAFLRPPSGARAQAECSELIGDGGFETGGAWQFSAGPAAPSYITYQRHGGDKALRLGIDDGQNVAGSSSARQKIALPASADQITLSFWSYTFFTGPPGSDFAQLDLLGPDGYTVLERLWAADNDSRVWSEQTIDLTRWRGSTAQIYFTVFNDGQGSTAGMYLDDVSVQSCPLEAALSQTPATATQPTPSATPSPTPIPNVVLPTETVTSTGPSELGGIPAGCLDLLQNGGFEQLLAGWIRGRDPVLVEIAGAPVHSGTYALKLGEDAGNVHSYSSVRQPVTIPAGYGQVLLDFWTWTWADDAGGSDHQEADFLSSNGRVLQKFWRVVANDRAWVQHILPVTAYSGQAVQVYLNAYNDGGRGQTGMYLDDVHLWGCPSPVALLAGQPVATPPAVVPPQPAFVSPPPTATPLPPVVTPLPTVVTPLPTATLPPIGALPAVPQATTSSQAGAVVTVIALGRGAATALGQGVATVIAQGGSAAPPTPRPPTPPLSALLGRNSTATPSAPGIAPVSTPPSASPLGRLGAAISGWLGGAARWLAANWPQPWWMPIVVVAALIVVLILLRMIFVGGVAP